MFRRFLSVLAAAAVAVLTVVSVASAADSRTVRVAFAGFGAGTVVTWIARDTELFAKYGLDIDPVYIDGATAGGVQSLLGVDIFVASEDVMPTLEAISGGADLVFVGGHASPENYHFGVASYVDDLAQLKGKKVAVSNLGRKSDLIARILLRRAGLNPVEDVEMVPIGFSPQRAAALFRNVVQAAPLVRSVAAQVQHWGIKVLDLGQVHLTTDLLVTSRSFVERRPNELRRFLMAYLNGIQHFLAERADTMRIIDKYVTLAQGATLPGTYNALAQRLEPLPVPRIEGVQALIDAVAVTDERARRLDPQRFLELDTLKRLDKGGFVKGLYAEKIKL
ncbi:MAG: ABC transporter substrate-binding protein [Deltaproteobacteria bacterium]|nr:ABC transporter substrate-binding protein [Deltaproteobacteria bacterium]